MDRSGYPWEVEQKWLVDSLMGLWAGVRNGSEMFVWSDRKVVGAVYPQRSGSCGWLEPV